MLTCRTAIDERKEINRHWKRIINTMAEGLMLVGKDGTILMVNDAFENLTGYSADDIISLSNGFFSGCAAGAASRSPGSHPKRSTS